MKGSFRKYSRAYRWVIILMLFTPIVFVKAAEPEVHARLSADTVMIGDHFYLDIEITKDMVQVMEFPNLDKSMMDGSLELLEDYPVDTVSVEGRTQKLLKRYKMICFEEGIYNIDSFPVLYLDKNIVDTIYSPEKNSLFVDTYVVDTVNKTIFDIKQPFDAPFWVTEASGYVKWILLIACSLIAAIYFISKRMGRNMGEIQKPRPKEAPHVVAIRELEQLHNQKVWQNNKHKLYYTRLTDILREYIAGRYGISAREMTSDEILDAIDKFDLNQTDISYLESVLRDADLVKFAKYLPEAERNEEDYMKSYYFVENTKQVLDESIIDVQEEPIVETDIVQNIGESKNENNIQNKESDDLSANVIIPSEQEQGKEEER